MGDLSSIRLLAGLGGDAYEGLLRQGRRRSFNAGDTIVYAGDRGMAVYFILSGCVKVHGTQEQGEEVVFEFLAAGDVFGEMAVLEAQPRTADVTAVEPTEVFILEGERFLDLLDSQPVVRRNLLRIQATRIRRLGRRLTSIATQDIYGRVAARLLEMARDQGAKASGPCEVKSTATQADLAAMVGASRESVNKVLAYFRRKGILETAPGRITLLKPEELQRRAQLPRVMG